MSVLADPLAGLAFPDGDPDAVRRTAARHSGAATELDAAARRRHDAASEFGRSWTGSGADRCSGAFQAAAAALQSNARHSEQFSSTLHQCAHAWDQARARYGHARHLADNALAEESAHRAADGAAAWTADLLLPDQANTPTDNWVSPLRRHATALARAAIDDFDNATRRAAHTINALHHDLTTPHLTSPHHLWDPAARLKEFAEQTLNTVAYALDHPDRQTHLALDALTITGGTLLLDAAGGIEIGGTVLDATGVGAIAGVPLNIIGAATATAGTALISGADTLLTIHRMNTDANPPQPPNSGGAGEWKITQEGTARTLRSPRFGKFFQSKTDGLWWSRDTAGHGGSEWKVFHDEGDDGLEWKFDADARGNVLEDKHKSDIGKFIPWKQLHS